MSPPSQDRSFFAISTRITMLDSLFFVALLLYNKSTSNVQLLTSGYLRSLGGTWYQVLGPMFMLAELFSSPSSSYPWNKTTIFNNCQDIQGTERIRQSISPLIINKITKLVAKLNKNNQNLIKVPKVFFVNEWDIVYIKLWGPV